MRHSFYLRLGGTSARLPSLVIRHLSLVTKRKSPCVSLAQHPNLLAQARKEQED